MMNTVRSALIAALVAMSSNVVLAEYVIDGFNAPGFPGAQRLSIDNIVAGTLGNTVHNGGAALGVLGGTRDLQVTRENPVGSVYIDSNQLNLGFLTYVQAQTNATDDVNGTFTVTWDGTADGGGIADVHGDPSGLGGISAGLTLGVLDQDLTQGGINDAIHLGFLSNSAAVLSLTMNVYDGSGLSSTFSIPAFAPGNAQSFDIAFSLFSNPAAFDHVHAMQMVVDMDHSVGGATFTLDSISAVASPEPSSLALAGLGVVGLLVRWRSRNRKTAGK